MPGEFRGVLHRAEIFGHAYGALAILVTAYVLDVRQRRKLVHVAACFVTAGLTADLIKLQIWRSPSAPVFRIGWARVDIFGIYLDGTDG